MDLEYGWRFKFDEQRIEIAMQVYKDGVECFFAGLYLRNQTLTDAGLRRATLRYPLQNLRTLARIYWQALRLYLKRTPFHAHPLVQPTKGRLSSREQRHNSGRRETSLQGAGGESALFFLFSRGSLRPDAKSTAWTRPPSPP